MRLARLVYLLSQHPIHAHRALVRRGLRLDWIDAFIPYWETVRPRSMPITDYASWVAMEYYCTERFRDEYPEGDHFGNRWAQLGRLLSYVRRRELHPLRWLPAAWHLRACDTVLEFGAGAAPYAHGIATAWPGRHQWIEVVDLPGLLLDYCRWRFRDHPDVAVEPVGAWEGYDGIVATEVFEHLEEPLTTAKEMMLHAGRVVFDYTESAHPGPRYAVLEAFRASGILTGPDPRGLYLWRRP